MEKTYEMQPPCAYGDRKSYDAFFFLNKKKIPKLFLFSNGIAEHVRATKRTKKNLSLSLSLTHTQKKRRKDIEDDLKYLKDAHIRIYKYTYILLLSLNKQRNKKKHFPPLLI
ncbi:hypothetical protein, unlikely [Trypanosoma brucei gambiense DAL972]|uniref:Uncharacterized protein n=1 Tax=Trypanosoma brucei gambiense (strain MHOM/CI/86/DAL972) TaxID=679716 RepID=D0A3D2_TRYB9|nr:hypothetical protein, unlikely [Trypanosoma brucei gambiense DAL972]CBH15776.1 hypothetical protein, unlikely [Trypanosoma brucei gambiense DAL972]|eukprot:XP_011778040.1 hypothetical protein, unlikely [Trypanosoma brucei gambiense DAL972]